MFVTFKNPIKRMGVYALAGMMIGAMGVSAFAAKMDGNTSSVDVTLNGVKASEGPLYISIQKREDYMSNKGTGGGIIKTVTPGVMQASFAVPPGDYAVSIWHDLDNDGQFSMTDTYIPMDGYGSSGTSPRDRKPVFDEVKVNVGTSAKAVNIDMIYLSGKL